MRWIFGPSDYQRRKAKRSASGCLGSVILGLLFLGWVGSFFSNDRPQAVVAGPAPLVMVPLDPIPSPPPVAVSPPAVDPEPEPAPAAEIADAVPETPAPEAKAEVKGFSSRYQAELRRTAERRKERAAAHRVTKENLSRRP